MDDPLSVHPDWWRRAVTPSAVCITWSAAPGETLDLSRYFAPPVNLPCTDDSACGHDSGPPTLSMVSLSLSPLFSAPWTQPATEPAGSSDRVSRYPELSLPSDKSYRPFRSLVRPCDRRSVMRISRWKFDGIIEAVEKSCPGNGSGSKRWTELRYKKLLDAIVILYNIWMFYNYIIK